MQHSVDGKAANGSERFDNGQQEAEMSAGGQSLRWLIDKWFGLGAGNAYRLTRSPCAESSSCRYVCLEAIRTGCALKIFFFRHEDRSWSVFPPAPKRPTLTLD